jgi:hypothetical protein
MEESRRSELKPNTVFKSLQQGGMKAKATAVSANPENTPNFTLAISVLYLGFDELIVHIVFVTSKEEERSDV